MNKIPVGETVSSAYSFAFAGILSVIGIFWFPYLVYAALMGGAIYLLAPDLPHQIMFGPYDFSLFVSAQRVRGIGWLLGLIIPAMVTIGLQRRAQDIDGGPKFIYFSLGSAVWRMIGANILATILVVVVGLLSVGVCTAIWFAAGYIGQNTAIGLVRTFSIIAGICWFVYFIVRLTFLLPAVVAAEGGIGLGRAWTLGGGNFWRIFVVWIAIFLPALIGFGMIEQAIIGPFMFNPHFNEFLAHPPPDVHGIINLFMQQFRVIGPLFLAFAVLAHIVFTALGNGASASAYRHLASGS